MKGQQTMLQYTIFRGGLPSWQMQFRGQHVQPSTWLEIKLNNKHQFWGILVSPTATPSFVRFLLKECPAAKASRYDLKYKRKRSDVCWWSQNALSLSSSHLIIPLEVQLAGRWLDMKQIAGPTWSQCLAFATNDAKNTVHLARRIICDMSKSRAKVFFPLTFNCCDDGTRMWWFFEGKMNWNNLLKTTANDWWKFCYFTQTDVQQHMFTSKTS